LDPSGRPPLRSRRPALPSGCIGAGRVERGESTPAALARKGNLPLLKREVKVSQLEFDRRLVERLERLYTTRDVLRRRELVRAALGARPRDRILDVGCGPGFYITELLEAVGREGSIVGLDASADMLAVAAKRAERHDNVTFHKADATSLPVPDASFERAICVQVLEYVRDVPAALKEMYRALRRDGRVLVWDVDWATVSWQAIDRQLARRVLAVWDKHLKHPSLPRTLAAQLRNAGFEDVRMDAHAFATTELIPDAYGGSLVPLLEQYVADQGGMSQKAKAWPMSSANSATVASSASRSPSSALRQPAAASRRKNGAARRLKSPSGTCMRRSQSRRRPPLADCLELTDIVDRWGL
jgi:arsenite methyltransferase